jgi:N-acetyl-alpha-D-muramate 1-phosphate uridylyltransferase
MLLAAGRGERLRPLTDTLPKALVPVLGKPLIAWHLERLAAAGFRDAVVNVAHLGEKITAALGDGRRFGVSIRYSREPEPLETAGGIASALPLLDAAPFLLVNADIFCEYDFARLRGFALGTRLAHLVLVPNPPHRPNGDFALEDGTVRGKPGDGTVPRYTYAGLAVVAPRLVDGVAAGTKAPLAPLLYAAADRGQLGGEAYDGLWQDVGTVERLAQLESLLNSRQEMRRNENR